MTAQNITDIALSARRIRLIEEAIAAKYLEGKMRTPTHFSIGQELPAAIAGAVRQPGDRAYSTHRNHAHYLAWGGSLDAMVAELHGKATGALGGRAGSMHLADPGVGFMGTSPIVGSSAALGIGSAWTSKLTGDGAVTWIFAGDAVPETGQFWEAVNFAALHRLPVVFVAEDNGYATSTPLRARQPDRSLTDAVRGMGFTYAIDCGDDVMPSVAAPLFEYARARTPAIIHYTTYRHRGHVGPGSDDDLGYRSAEEVSAHLADDPVINALKLAGLLEHGDGKVVEAHTDAVHAEIRAAFKAAEEAPWPQA